MTMTFLLCLYRQDTYHPCEILGMGNGAPKAMPLQDVQFAVIDLVLASAMPLR
jgi:hypothetical protein